MKYHGQIQPDREEIRCWIEEKLPQFLQDLTRICKIPSVARVNDTDNPPFGTECIRALEEMLQIGSEYGLSAENFENYVGRISYGKGEHSIGIWSHLDVVEVQDGWQYPPFEPTVKDGYVIARGCQDNKSSAVMALYVLLYLKEHGIETKHSIHAYMGTCEEKGMYDLDYFVKHYDCPDLSLVPDSGFPVCCGERGAFNGELKSDRKVGARLIDFYSDNGLYQVPDQAYAVVKDCDGIRNLCQKLPAYVKAAQENGNWRISYEGVAAHGAAPSSGRNALTGLAETLCGYHLVDPEDEELLTLCSELNRDGKGTALDVACEDEISGPMVLTVTQGRLEDGHLVFGFMSKYPVTCNALPMEERASKAAGDRGFQLKVTRYAKANYFDPSHPAVEILTRTYNEISGEQSKPFVMSGGTYARKLPRAFAYGTGMPLSPPPEGLFLPGHGDYHQPDEAISVERMKRSLLIYICGILQVDQLI